MEDKEVIERFDEDIPCSSDCYNELKALCEEYLDKCDENVTPKLCKMKEKPSTYRDLVEKAITLIANEGHDIKSAFMHLERVYNQNMRYD